MFSRILLPLDGSRLAEIAVPYGEMLAGRLGSGITLLHACHSEDDPYRHMHHIYLDHMAATMQRRIRKDWRGAKPGVRAEVAVGNPADIICDYVQKNDIEMVVMATSGASGIKVWMLGSVADKVVRAVNVPILLIRASDARPAEGEKRTISRILLPLDGSEASKMSIPYAQELARRLKASITLFQMAPKTYPPSHVPASINVDWARVDRAEEIRARTYLSGVEKELRQAGIPVTHAVTLGTDPAYEILEQEGKTNADLVVMATRGKSPVTRWVFGSVTEKVLREGNLPLLLVRR